jgi:hypothetical protein
VLDFPPQEATRHFWVRQATLRLVLTGESISLLPIAETSLVLLEMPYSEAEVERMFTHLRRLFDDYAQYSRGDLIKVRLTIMMNNLDVSRESMRDFSQVEHEILGMPPEANSPWSAPPLTVRVLFS